MSNLNFLISNLISGDDEQAEAAAVEMAAFGADALPALKELLGSSDADTRWWATRALAGIAHPESTLLLRKGLSDPDLSVRQCAALAFKEHASGETIPDLISALNDHDQLLRRLAAEALIAVGPGAVPALIEIMQIGPQVARLEAVRALALIGDRAAIPALFDVLDDDSATVGYWAEEGLERLGVEMVFFTPDR
ncbi:MAG: HEAT repeat domain-containing protein [Chloroflexi bacterium]|nr:HEAT repeat domain-containing protein [Chloroflexota bacterium]